MRRTVKMVKWDVKSESDRPHVGILSRDEDSCLAKIHSAISCSSDSGLRLAMVGYFTALAQPRAVVHLAVARSRVGVGAQEAKTAEWSNGPFPDAARMGTTEHARTSGQKCDLKRGSRKRREVPCVDFE
jgi:hypothetical protein